MIKIQGNIQYVFLTFCLTFIFFVQILGINGNSLLLNQTFLPFRVLLLVLGIVYMTIFVSILIWKRNTVSVILQKTILNFIFYGSILVYLSTINTSKFILNDVAITPNWLAVVGIILCSIINFGLLKTKSLKLDNYFIALITLILSLISYGFMFSKNLDVSSYRSFNDGILSNFFNFPKYIWLIFNSFTIGILISLKNKFSFLEAFINFFVVLTASSLFTIWVNYTKFSYWHYAILTTTIANFVLNYYQIAKLPNDHKKNWRYIFSSLYHFIMIILVFLITSL